MKSMNFKPVVVLLLVLAVSCFDRSCNFPLSPFMFKLALEAYLLSDLPQDKKDKLLDLLIKRDESRDAEYGTFLKRQTGTDEWQQDNTGAVSGYVTGDGLPLQGAFIDGVDSDFFIVASAVSDSNGYYLMRNLPTNEPMRFRCWDAEWGEIWWDGKRSFDSADTVSLAPDDTLKHIDFHYFLPGTISGQITHAGAPVQGMAVQVIDAMQIFEAGWDYTDHDGNYRVSVPPGRYILWTVDPEGGRAELLWDNKTSFLQADTLVVNSGDSLTHIDFDLPEGGFISGLITDETGTSLSGVGVFVYDSRGHIISGASSSESGRYTIYNLPLGKYRLKIFSKEYANEWWQNRGSFASADTLTVTALDTTRADFQIQKAGYVAGTITGPDPQKTSLLFLQDSSGIVIDFMEVARVQNDGRYAVPLAPDEYIVRTLNSDDYIDEYYKEQLYWAQANKITVAVQDTVHADFSLQKGGIIKGNVVLPDGTTPLEGAGVLALSSTTGEVMARATSTKWGEYRIGGLPDGTFKIVCLPSMDSLYAFEFYNDADDWASATPVRISAGDSSTNIDFALQVGGAISGHVYVGSSKTPVAESRIVLSVPTNSLYGWIPALIATTDYTGKYTISGLRTGFYKIHAELKGEENLWWSGASNASDADSVAVVMPDTTTGIDFHFNPTSVSQGRHLLFDYGLYQNYPNPFNQETTIRFEISRPSFVNLTLYDINGRMLKTIVNKRYEAGQYQVTLRATNMASGIYLYKIQAGDFVDTKKILLLK